MFRYFIPRPRQSLLLITDNLRHTPRERSPTRQTRTGHFHSGPASRTLARRSLLPGSRRRGGLCGVSAGGRWDVTVKEGWKSFTASRRSSCARKQRKTRSGRGSSTEAVCSGERSGAPASNTGLGCLYLGERSGAGGAVRQGEAQELAGKVVA